MNKLKYRTKYKGGKGIANEIVPKHVHWPAAFLGTILLARFPSISRIYIFFYQEI